MPARTVLSPVGALLVMLASVAPAQAQNRGVYPLGMNATNAGVTPEPGVSYAHQLLFYARDEQRGADGEVIQTGNNSVILAMSTFIWVSRATVPGGATFSMTATLPITNNSLTADASGPISGGGGFADSYYQPVVLAWQPRQAAIRLVYGFLAPTGAFSADATTNTGSGYWTHALSSGQTWTVGSSRAVAVSAFQMYEVHTRQADTGMRPGQTLSLDYSVTHSTQVLDAARLQAGLAGYGQWQTTDTRDANGTARATRYRVNAVGFTIGLAWPERAVSLNFKAFKEFANRSTFQGYSTQIAGAIHF